MTGPCVAAADIDAVLAWCTPVEVLVTRAALGVPTPVSGDRFAVATAVESPTGPASG